MVWNSTFKQFNRHFLVLLSIFVRWKVSINENVNYTGYTSGIRLPNWSKLAIYGENENDVNFVTILLKIDQKGQNRKYPYLSFSDIWKLGWVRDTKFGANVSNKMLLNAAKCQSYRFYHFWVIKGNPTGGGRKTRLGLKGRLLFNLFFCFCMFVNKYFTNFTGELF